MAQYADWQLQKLRLEDVRILQRETIANISGADQLSQFYFQNKIQNLQKSPPMELFCIGNRIQYTIVWYRMRRRGIFALEECSKFCTPHHGWLLSRDNSGKVKFNKLK